MDEGCAHFAWPWIIDSLLNWKWNNNIRAGGRCRSGAGFLLCAPGRAHPLAYGSRTLARQRKELGHQSASLDMWLYKINGGIGEAHAV